MSHDCAVQQCQKITQSTDPLEKVKGQIFQYHNK